MADFGQGRATVWRLHLGTFDAGVDEQQVEDFVLELLAQLDHRLLIVHVEFLDPHIAQRLEGLGVLRIAHGGGDLPAVGKQGFHQAEAKAPGGADDQCSSGHVWLP
ncbi:hypothetical protein D9M73_265730 [compost metagenome]